MLVAEEAERLLEEVGRRRVVGVEDRDEIGLRVAQRVVEVAGLGVRILRAREVATTEFVREHLHLESIAVVEQPDLVGLLHALRGHDRAAHDVDRLVDRRDEHGDRGVLGDRQRRALLAVAST